MPVPYKEAFGEVDLNLTGYQFDNSGPDNFDLDTRIHDLRKYADNGWEEITIEGTIELPSAAKELFPPDERSDPPGEVLVGIDYIDTHYREGKTVSVTNIEPGTYSFKETLSREYAYGEVRFRPLLVRTGPCDEAGFARYPYMRIADGTPLVISFDDVETPGSDFMDVRFESFEETEGVPDHNLYQLDRTDVNNPRVWVNEDYELITRVLDNDAHAGWASNMQAGIAAWIAKDVVTELILWAIVCADNGEFEAEWQASLLEDYGPCIYEYTEDADEPSGLYEQINDGGDSAHYVINAVEKAVQDQIRITKPIEEFIEKEATDYFLRSA